MDQRGKQAIRLVDELFAGAIDVVGDVHGEVEAMVGLLDLLGYRQDGSHPEGRRLVFVGDIVDRGPDSPAVVELVIDLVEQGRAQCVLGNHELNLLLGDKKEGNHWFTDPSDPERFPSRSVRPAQKDRFLEFLGTLPLVLERDDLRVVHACWNEDAVERLRLAESSTISAAVLHQRYRSRIDQDLRDSGVFSRYRQEQEMYSKHLVDQSWFRPVFLPAHAAVAETRQTDNPVKVVTSGEERTATRPFWAGGRWRMVERQKWWERYEDDVPVVVGHYWRRFGEAGDYLMQKYGPDLFEGIQPHEWMGKRRNVYCVDFSVGRRHREREQGNPPFEGRLSALRVPEWEVWHDDGSPRGVLSRPRVE